MNVKNPYLALIFSSIFFGLELFINAPWAFCSPSPEPTSPFFQESFLEKDRNSSHPPEELQNASRESGNLVPLFGLLGKSHLSNLYLSTTFLKLYPQYTLVSDQSCLRDQNVSLEFFEHRTGELQPSSITTNQDPQTIDIIIQEQSAPNAYALPMNEGSQTPAQIILNQGLLESIRDESELAFVLAHEISHIRHNHFQTHLPELLLTVSQIRHIDSVHRAWELAADQEAIADLKNSGFNILASISVLERFCSFQNSTERKSISHHPAMIERILALKNYASDQTRVAGLSRQVACF